MREREREERWVKGGGQGGREIDIEVGRKETERASVKLMK